MLNKLKLLEIIQRIPNKLANFFSPGFALCSFIPRKEFKILCKYTWYYYKLILMKSSERIVFKNAFTVCNVILDIVGFTSSITDYLIFSFALICDMFILFQDNLYFYKHAGTLQFTQ